MASITLIGSLLDPNGFFSVGDKVRFTHKTNTGSTIKSAVSTITIPPDGSYNITLQYGLVRVQYRDILTGVYKDVGVVTVNQDSTATTLPELLNAVVPPTDDQLLEFQAILADCVDAQNNAAQSLSEVDALTGQQTTTELINSSVVYDADKVLETSGFTTAGDGGNGKWKQNGVTGQTPSQTPAQLGDALLNDASGNQWALVWRGSVDARAFGLTSAGIKTAEVKAIAGGIGDGQEVFFPVNFAIDERVDFNTSCIIDLRNSIIDGSSLPNSTVDRDLNIALNFSGSIESAETITENLSVGDQSFKTASPTMSEGDTVIIQSDQLFVDSWDGSINNKRGEIVTVKSVSGITVEFNEPLYFSYDSTQNLRATKVNTITPTVKGGVIKMGGVGSEHRGVNFAYCRDFTCKGVLVDKAEDFCYQAQYCHSGVFDVVAMNATTPTSGFNTGYGVSLVSGTRNIDVNVTGYNCKHVVTGGSELPVLDVKIKGTAYDSGITSTSWDCHEPCFRWDWDVKSYGCNAGIGIRGSDQTIKLECQDLASNALRVRTFNDVGSQYNIHATINSKRTGSTVATFKSTLNTLSNCSLKVVSEYTTLDGIGVTGNSTYSVDDFRLDMNIDEATSTGVTALYCNDLIINMDRATNIADKCGRFENCNGISLNAKNITSATSQALRFENCNNIDISGKSITSNANSAIFTDSCNNVKLSVARVKSTGASQDGWRAVDTSGCSVIGTKFESGRHAVYSSGASDKFICTSNDVTDVASGDKFNLSGSTNTEANNLS